MKVSSFCAPCKAKRFYGVTCLSTKDEGTRARTMVKVLAKIQKTMAQKDCPSFSGTVLSEMIMGATGNRDPYKRKKAEAIRRAKQAFPEFRKWVLSGKTDYERFRRAVMLAMAGNALELSAPNYEVNLGDLKKETWRLVRKKPAIGHIRRIFGKVKEAGDVLYLCDNCGEAVFDEPLVEEIGRHAKVTVAVNSVPMDEDVSMLQVKGTGLANLAPVIGKGRSYGVWKRRASGRFWKRLKSAGFVIGKGMANYETMDEYQKLVRGRGACLMVVKCETVGKSLRVPVGKLVAKAF